MQSFAGFPHFAIQDTTASITYAGLADLANRIAAAIIVAFQGRLGPVAVLLPAGAKDSCCHAWRAGRGRAYVVIDANSPTQRRASIISQTGACAIIVNWLLSQMTRPFCCPSCPSSMLTICLGLSGQYTACDIIPMIWPPFTLHRGRADSLKGSP